MAYAAPVTAVNTNQNVNTGAGGPGTGAWDGVATGGFTVNVTRLLLVYQTTTPSENGVWIKGESERAGRSPRGGEGHDRRDQESGRKAGWP